MHILRHQHLTSATFFPGLMSRMAASKAVLAAAMTSAALPVTAASSSDCTTNVCAAVATKPSMCDPRSLQRNHSWYVAVCWLCYEVVEQSFKSSHSVFLLLLGLLLSYCNVLVSAPALQQLLLQSQLPAVHLCTVSVTVAGTIIAGKEAHIFTTSPSFSSDVSSPCGEKCPTMLHTARSELTAELSRT